MYHNFIYLSVGGIPARHANGDRLLLFIGIIDILQNYRLVKKMEHVFKAVVHDGVILLHCYYTFFLEARLS